ncbi:MAG: ribonuclease P protein component [Fuscovulum sp.]|jgi:ribonuclease P protein component|nr:ribonuclease P protein component [Fuscovulum sp.]
MTPPRAQDARHPAAAPAAPPAVSFCVLQTRPEFLKAASARRHGTAGFLLQARDRRDDRPLVQIGYTASKKIGNAVLRNRAKRRLREVARAVMPGLARPGWDYVLVARPQATVTRPFGDLLRDLEAALAAVHRAK